MRRIDCAGVAMQQRGARDRRAGARGSFYRSRDGGRPRLQYPTLLWERSRAIASGQWPQKIKSNRKRGRSHTRHRPVGARSRAIASGPIAAENQEQSRPWSLPQAASPCGSALARDCFGPDRCRKSRAIATKVAPTDGTGRWERARARLLRPDRCRKSRAIATKVAPTDGVVRWERARARLLRPHGCGKSRSIATRIAPTARGAATSSSRCTGR